MPDRKKITIKNYQQFKPSDLIEASLTDLDTAMAAGIDINMRSWFGAYQNTDDGNVQNCWVCLGGAVLAGMIPEIGYQLSNSQPSKCSDLMFENKAAQQVAFLFDDVRCYNISGVAHLLWKLYELESEAEVFECLLANWKGRAFYGILNTDQVERLKNSIKSLVAALRTMEL